MTRVYFVRHGESVANAGGVTMDHAVIPLSPLGLVQAQAIASVLDVVPSKVLVSAYTRARQTAQPFCDTAGCQAEVHPLLHEFSALDPALVEGMTGEQRRPITAAYWHMADPAVRMGESAETFLEFNARVTDFVTELARLPDRCVLFGHGIWFGLLAWHLLGFGASDSQGMKGFRGFQLALPMPNCAVYVLEIGPGQRWSWYADEQAMRRMAVIRLS